MQKPTLKYIVDSTFYGSIFQIEEFEFQKKANVRFWFCTYLLQLSGF